MSGKLETCSRQISRQRGWLSMEALFALMLFAAMIPLLNNVYANYQIENQTRLAADHLKELEAAVGRYVKSNWETLAATVTPTTAIEIDPADLKSQGFLRDSISTQSPYQQDYHIGIIGPSGGPLTSVILGHGGRPGTGVLSGANLKLATEIIPATALKVGMTGGVIPYAELPSASATVIEGVNGTWTLDIGSIAGLNSVGAGSGSLASVSFYVDGAVNNDYLHRRDIGIPELNQMQTNLDMNGNDIANIKSATDMTGFIHTTGDELAEDRNGNPVNAFVAERGSIELRDGIVKAGDVIIDDTMIAGGPVPMSRGVYDVRILAPREIMPKPTCPTGSIPQIFVSAESVPVGEDMVFNTTSGTRSGDVEMYNTFAQNVGTSSWRVGIEIAVGTASGRSWYELADGARLLATAKCT